MTKHLYRILLLILVALTAVACRQDTTVSAENINLDVAVDELLVGETTMTVTVTDAESNAIENPGTLNVRGDMDHAGMVPVIVDVEDSTDGVFSVPFEWTMGGAWTVTATLTLSDDATVSQTFDYEILAEDSDMDMSDMDMDAEDGDMDMSDMDMDAEDGETMHMSGETSAVYMQLSNTGEETITVVDADSTVPNIVELHETIIENDVARMEPVPAIVIEPGETVELRPGGKHVMLINLTQSVAIDDEVEIELTFESGETATLTALVQDMMMDPIENETVIGDLTANNVWARPAGAGMTNMNADEDTEAEGTGD